MPRLRVVLSLVPLVAAGCGSDSSVDLPGGSNKAVDVYTLNTVFSPNFVQISPGDTVRFNIATASNGEGHDVTFDSKPGAPANIKVTFTGVISRVFNTRGTFHYNCFVHPGMSGDVVVQ